MKAVYLFLALLWTTAPAFAVESGDIRTARAFGLLGSWSQDCSIMDPEKSSRFVVSDGKVMDWIWEDGPDEIYDLRRISTNKLAGTMHLTLLDETVRIVWERQNGRLRIIETVESDGNAYVSNGLSTIESRPMSWMKRCSDRD